MTIHVERLNIIFVKTGKIIFGNFNRSRFEVRPAGRTNQLDGDVKGSNLFARENSLARSAAGQNINFLLTTPPHPNDDDNYYVEVLAETTEKEEKRNMFQSCR